MSDAIDDRRKALTILREHYASTSKPKIILLDELKPLEQLIQVLVRQ